MKPGLQLKISAKSEELKNLQDIKTSTDQIADQLELIGQKLDIMTDGAESVALILSNWKNVVDSISLASLGLLKYSSQALEQATPLPETLVRMNLHQDTNEGDEEDT